MRRPRDTSADAQSRYIRALGEIGPERRLASAAALSDEVRALAEAGIRARHPEFGPAEIRSALADILLGPELAERVRRERRPAAG
jgi:hypothetical protein